ncbi:MAG TPA: hypothetical protein VH120_21595 [Gemmataceae bacterium]|nr:hypothetical protein [Gemmataceae bacterium]
MNALYPRKMVLWSAIAAVCAVGALIASAQPPEPEPKKPRPKPQAAAGKIPAPGQPKSGTAPTTPTPVQFKAQLAGKPRKAIPYQPYTFDEFKKLWGDDKLTPQTMVTLKKRPVIGKPGGTAEQRVPAETCWNDLNKLEQMLSAAGYTLRPGNASSLPKGGLVMTLPTKGKPALAQQRATIAKDHHKAAPGKAQPAAKLTKDVVSADQKTRKAFDAARQTELHKALAKVDRTKLSPQEQKTLDQFSSGKPTGIKLPPLLLNHLGDVGEVFFPGLPNDYHKNWKWSAGSTDTAEINIVGDLDVSSNVSLAGGVEKMHARGTLEADCVVLGSSPQKIVEVVADFNFKSGESLQAPPSESLQASAKVVGQDLFTPINKTSTTGDVVNISQKHPFSFPVASGQVGLFDVPTPIGDLSLSLKYVIKAGGDFNFTITGKATPAGVSINPTATLGTALTADAFVDLVILDVGVEGTPNLVSDTLNLNGGVGIGVGGGGPFLDTTGSARDTVKLLGGDLDFLVKIDLGLFSEDIVRVKILSFPEFDPIDGFIFGPDEIKTPLQKQSAPAPAAAAKKK